MVCVFALDESLLRRCSDLMQIPARRSSHVDVDGKQSQAVMLSVAFEMLSLVQEIVKNLKYLNVKMGRIRLLHPPAARVAAKRHEVKAKKFLDAAQHLHQTVITLFA